MNIDDTKPRDIYLGMWIPYNEGEEDEITAFFEELQKYVIRKCPETAQFISREFIQKPKALVSCKYNYPTLGIKMKFHGIWPYESLKSLGMYLGN